MRIEERRKTNKALQNFQKNTPNPETKETRTNISTGKGVLVFIISEEFEKNSQLTFEDITRMTMEKFHIEIKEYFSCIKIQKPNQITLLGH